MIGIYNKDDNKIIQLAGASEIPRWSGTTAEWNALDKSTLVDGTYIDITDDLINLIDDTTPATDKVYSSSKVENDYGIKTYSTLNALGLSNGCSVCDIFKALPKHSMFIMGCNESTEVSTDNFSKITGLPTIDDEGHLDYGILTITKYYNGRFSIEFKKSAEGSKADNIMYIGSLQGSNPTEVTWAKLATTEKTTITDYIVNSTYATDNYHEYYVENGTVHIRGMLRAKAIIPANTIITLITVGKSYAPKGGGGFQFASDSFAKIYSMATKNTDGYGVCWVYLDIDIPVNSYCTYEASWRID